MLHRIFPLLCLGVLVGCVNEAPRSVAQRVADYSTFRLTTDLSHLTAKERAMLPLLISAADEMNDLFWKQAIADRASLDRFMLSGPENRLIDINYGPWDRLDGNAPFIDGVEAKPKGAAFYPTDMTREEFEEHLKAHPEDAESFKSLYTIIKRKDDGTLHAVPYSVHFADELKSVAAKLRQAAELAEDAGFKNYLELRAKALLDDDYQPSDMAWMDMKTNRIDIVIGPIESYEDALFGQKAAFEAYVLVKDLEWSERLTRYAAVLPELQRGLPVSEEYKKESPGTNSDLNAYDAIYYAGDCNSGSKTIAINLPNDEEVQLAKGTRRLQLKNSIRAKFDRILLPISTVLIAEDQRKHINFESFFGNIMFHEVAHGLGIKKTVDGAGTVREALKEEYSAFEEGKADVLGLYMVSKLIESKQWTEATLMDHYVTFLAGIFRSVRFGASSAHGRANMLRFNFFEELGAFSRDSATGTYRVHPDRMKDAVAQLSEKILRVQGDGDYAGAKKLVKELGGLGGTLKDDLARLSEEGIPVDIVFEQGMKVLGLEE